MAGLLQAWDGYRIALNEFTLFPSVSLASLGTLATLKDIGVRRIIFETPSYFGSIEQAVRLGFACDLIPTYLRDGYSLPSLQYWIRDGVNTAIWLTQPRASLGFDQSIDLIDDLMRRLPSTSYLIIDEATDQTFPLHLGAFAQSHRLGNLIRLRSFTKGMGLNGIRLAAIVHSSALRDPIVHCLQFLGSTIDAFSPKAIGILGEDTTHFSTMLRAANEQVINLRTRVEGLLLGTPITVNRLINGYMGTMVADLTALGDDHPNRRVQLLEGCRRVRTPVLLGASLYVATDPPYEAIRLNFFKPGFDLLRGIANILSIWDAS